MTAGDRGGQAAGDVVVAGVVEAAWEDGVVEAAVLWSRCTLAMLISVVFETTWDRRGLLTR